MKRTVHITLTPTEMAARFCEMGSDEQAEFFAECGRLASDWGASKRDMQWLSVGDAARKNFDAANALSMMAAPLFSHTMFYIDDNSKLQAENARLRRELAEAKARVKLYDMDLHPENYVDEDYDEECSECLGKGWDEDSQGNRWDCDHCGSSGRVRL